MTRGGGGGRGHEQLDIEHRRAEVGVFLRDGLPLLGHAQAAPERTGGQRLHEPVRRTRTAPHRAPSSVEKHRLHPVPPNDQREFRLRAMQRGLAGENAAVLVGIRIADHHLKRRIRLRRDAAPRDRVLEKLVGNARSGLEVGHGFKQGRDRQRAAQPVRGQLHQARLARQHVDNQQVLHAAGHRDDERPESGVPLRRPMRRQHPVAGQHRVRFQAGGHARREKRPGRHQFAFEQPAFPFAAP